MGTPSPISSPVPTGTWPASETELVVREWALQQPFGTLNVVGLVDNAGGGLAVDVTLVVTFLDRDGNVLASQQQYRDEFGYFDTFPAVPPGATVPFILIVPPELEGEGGTIDTVDQVEIALRWDSPDDDDWSWYSHAMHVQNIVVDGGVTAELTNIGAAPAGIGQLFIAARGADDSLLGVESVIDLLSSAYADRVLQPGECIAVETSDSSLPADASLYQGFAWGSVQ